MLEHVEMFEPVRKLLHHWPSLRGLSLDRVLDLGNRQLIRQIPMLVDRKN